MEIEEIVQIALKFRGRKAFRSEEPKRKKADSKFNLITSWLFTGEVETFEEAAKRLNYNINAVSYRMLKSRYLHSLLQLFFDESLESSLGSNYSRAKYKCSLYQHAIRIMAIYGGHNSAKSLSEKIQLTAERFELYEYLIFSSSILRNVYALSGDLKSVQLHSIKIQQTSNLYNSELQSNGLLLTMYAIYSMPKPRNSANILAVETLMKQAAKIRDNFETYNNSINYLRIKGNYYLLIKDYKKSNETWGEMERVIEKYNEFEFDTRISEIATYKLTCYLNLRDYFSGSEYAIKLNRYFQEGAVNWFVQNEYRFLFFIHIMDYSQADLLLKATVNHKRYKYLNDLRKERWRIYGAYLHFISLLNNEADIFTKKTFKQIITEHPHYSMDKQGMYLSISILMIMNLARKREFNLLGEKILSLTRLEKKYLADDAFDRVKLFISLLKLSHENNFFKGVTMKASESIIQKLKDTIPAYTGNLIGFEIIPYEKLWNYYLGLLK